MGPVVMVIVAEINVVRVIGSVSHTPPSNNNETTNVLAASQLSPTTGIRLNNGILTIGQHTEWVPSIGPTHIGRLVHRPPPQYLAAR